MPKEMPLDTLGDSTGEVVYRRKNGELFKKIARETRFNEREVIGKIQSGYQPSSLK